VPCTASGRLPRLYIGADEVIRTVPGGRPLGKVGDDIDDVRATAAALAAQGVDACGGPGIDHELAAIDAVKRRVFLSVTKALRTMVVRTGRTWQVSGLDGRIAAAGAPAGATSARDDLLLLWSGTDHVLFSMREWRAFKVPQQVAVVLDVLLHAPSDSAARAWLAGYPGYPDGPDRAFQEVREAFTDRGLRLDVAA
jgi:hypothetical protein